MPPVLYHWYTTSRVDGGDVAVNTEHSHQLHYSLLPWDSRQQGGADWCVWHGNVYEAKLWNLIPPCRKKLHPLTFIDTCWILMETEQLMRAQWGGEWCVSAGWQWHERCLGRLCATVTPQNEEHLIQLIIRLGSADYSQETVHRLVGNDDGSVEILQSLHEAMRRQMMFQRKLLWLIKKNWELYSSISPS